MRALITTRDRDIPQEIEYSTGTYEKRRDDSLIESHSHEFVSVFKSVEILDNITPNYLARLKNGEIMINDFRKEAITIIDNPCSFTTTEAWTHKYAQYTDKFEWKNYSSISFLNQGNFPLKTAVDPHPFAGRQFNWSMSPLANYNVDTLVGQAVASAHADLNSTDFQALVSAAEARKTVATLKSVLQKLLRLIPKVVNYRRTLRSLSKRGIRKLSKDASKQWLEIRYGLRPIAYDAQNLYNAIQAIIEGHNRVRFYSGKELDPMYDSNDAQATDYGFQRYEQNSVSSRTVSARAGIFADVGVDGIKRVTRPLGLSQLTQSAWELTPFSFIVDWFFNVGDVISAWSPSSNTKILGSFVTVKDTYRFERSMNSFYDTNDTYSFLDINSEIEGVKYEYVHEVITRWSNPSVPAVPSLDISLNAAKVTDLLALVRALWRTRR